MFPLALISALLALALPCWGTWQPTPGTTFQWQLQGSIDKQVQADVFDIDLFDAAESDIHYLKSHGKKVICYFSAGSHENWRDDAGRFTHNVIGHKLEGWDGEHWLDIRSPLVRNIMATRLDLARQKSCDGVEPDNVDGYSNQNGLGLTKADQLDYNRYIASEAHSRGLSVGLKNAVDLIQDLEPNFDWALNEECLEYNECGQYQPFLRHNKAVFHVEYVDNHRQGDSKKRQVCHSSHRPSGFTTLIKDWDLTAWRLTC